MSVAEELEVSLDIRKRMARGAAAER